MSTHRGAAEMSASHFEMEILDAYGRGRRDERANRRGPTLLLGAMLCLAVVGALFLVLSAYKGSFSGGGHLFDRQLAQWRDGDHGDQADVDRIRTRTRAHGEQAENTNYERPPGAEGNWVVFSR